MAQNIIGLSKNTHSIYKTNTSAPNTIKAEKLLHSTNPASSGEVDKISSREKKRYEKVLGKPITTDKDLLDAKKMASDKAIADRKAAVEKRQKVRDDLAASKKNKSDSSKAMKDQLSKTTADIQAAYDGALSTKEACGEWTDIDFNISCHWFDLDKLKSSLDLSKYKEKLDTLINNTLAGLAKAATWGIKTFGNIVRCGAFLLGMGKRGIDGLFDRVSAVNPALTGVLVGAIMTGNAEGMTNDPMGMLKLALGDATPAQLEVMNSEDVFAIKDGNTFTGVVNVLKKMRHSDPHGASHLSGSRHGANGSSNGDWSDARDVASLMGMNTTVEWNAHNTVSRYMSRRKDPAFRQAYGKYVRENRPSSIRPINGRYYASLNPEVGVFTDQKTQALFELVTGDINERNSRGARSMRSGRPLNVNHLNAKRANATNSSGLVLEVDMGRSGLSREDYLRERAAEEKAMRRVAAAQIMVNLGDITPDQNLVDDDVVARYKRVTKKSTSETYRDLNGSIGKKVGDGLTKVAINQELIASTDPEVRALVDHTVCLDPDEQLVRDSAMSSGVGSGAIATKLKSYEVC